MGRAAGSGQKSLSPHSAIPCEAPLYDARAGFQSASPVAQARTRQKPIRGLLPKRKGSLASYQARSLGISGEEQWDMLPVRLSSKSEVTPFRGSAR